MRRPASGRAFLLAESGVLAALLLAWALFSHGRLTTEDWAGFLLAATPLAIAAMVQTVPILAGGQGLAAGATALLVDAVISAAPIDGLSSALLWIATGLVLGGGIGLANGLLIGVLRVPSTGVTYATGAGVGALAFLIAGRTGGTRPSQVLGDLLFGPQVLDLPVVPIVLLVLMAIAGVALQQSRVGRALRATGTRLGLAERRLPAARLRCLAYVIAGFGYAVAGIVLAGQVGMLDSMLAMPVLLQIFAAAALGGSCPGLRAGGTLGALLGAGIVTAAANLFIPLGVPDVLSPAVDAAWLLIGLAACFRFADRVPHIASPASAGLSSSRTIAIATVGIGLMVALPMLRPEAATVATVATGIGLLAVGQGAVMRAGGFDLSMPSVIAAAGITTVTISEGSWFRFLLTVGVVGITAVLLGLWHAMLARRLGRGIVLATLASAGAIQAVATALFVWAPTGFAPLELTAWVARTWLRIPIPVWVLLPAGIVIGFALDRRWRSGRESGSAYVASALTAASFGILAAAIGGNFRMGLVDTYLLPAVAGAVIGGVRFGRAGGSLLAAMGGALLVQPVDTALVTLNLSYELRLMLIATAMLAAVTLPQLGRRRART